MDDEFLYQPCDMHLRNRANRFANHMGSKEIAAEKIAENGDIDGALFSRKMVLEFMFEIIHEDFQLPV